ncbi:hypothetical protein AOQ84DRAFT_13228 [Glonium stellatum]|uniref:Uncharacterized protein n=1 Tax=Glonium stellatum TaxID=574774 RepID=A0A8E2F3J9_9PEZI|nr:hypothetical protein AOQ84DRAFT_13228 [Glonium stellatum]
MQISFSFYNIILVASQAAIASEQHTTCSDSNSPYIANNYSNSTTASSSGTTDRSTGDRSEGGMDKKKTQKVLKGMEVLQRPSEKS